MAKPTNDSMNRPIKMSEVVLNNTFIAVVLDLHTALLLDTLEKNRLLTLSDGETVFQCDLRSLLKDYKAQIKATLDFGWNLWNESSEVTLGTNGDIAHEFTLVTWKNYIFALSRGETH